MKITVSRKELAGALKVVKKATAVKPATPILAGIYFQASGHLLEMQATDHTIGIITKIPANVENDGEVVIIGKYILEMVLKLKGDTVTITTNNTEAEISSAGTKYNLLTANPSDFPKIKQEEKLQSFTLRQNVFKNLVRRTAFAAEDEKRSSRPIFTGVVFEMKGDNLTMVATNTHRLAVNYDKLSASLENELKFIVPAKILQEIAAMVDETGNIEICYSGKTAAFVFDNLFVTTRLISGDFPPFDRLLEEEKNIFVTVNVEEFRNAIERVAVIAKATDYQAIELNFSDNEITISASSPEVGNAEEIISAEIKGEDLWIAFNYNYFVEALKVIDTEKVKIGFGGQLKPADFQPVDDDSFRYIVTPVRKDR